MAETVLRLRISGKVQNVWFRGWLVELASGAGLRGWVRNRSDGTVEALLIGPESHVHEVAGHCRSGPPAAVVGKVEAATGHDDGSAGFRLRSTV
ncbi:MAG: acylphosphatase [Rhodospirillaceae bacterium]|nr:acylphosphatase [Rhodospirillaceae bacterium]